MPLEKDMVLFNKIMFCAIIVWNWPSGSEDVDFFQNSFVYFFMSLEIMLVLQSKKNPNNLELDAFYQL